MFKRSLALGSGNGRLCVLLRLKSGNLYRYPSQENLHNISIMYLYIYICVYMYVFDFIFLLFLERLRSLHSCALCVIDLRAVLYVLRALLASSIYVYMQPTHYKDNKTFSYC